MDMSGMSSIEGDCPLFLFPVFTLQVRVLPCYSRK